MKRLFPSDKALTSEHAAVLKIIAVELGSPVDAVYIGDGASGPAVFYEDRQGSEGTRCACLSGRPVLAGVPGARGREGAVGAPGDQSRSRAGVNGKLLQCATFSSLMLRPSLKSPTRARAGAQGQGRRSCGTRRAGHLERAPHMVATVQRSSAQLFDVFIFEIDRVMRHERCSDDESDSYPRIGYLHFIDSSRACLA